MMRALGVPLALFDADGAVPFATVRVHTERQFMGILHALGPDQYAWDGEVKVVGVGRP